MGSTYRGGLIASPDHPWGGEAIDVAPASTDGSTHIAAEATAPRCRPAGTSATSDQGAFCPDGVVAAVVARFAITVRCRLRQPDGVMWCAGHVGVPRWARAVVTAVLLATTSCSDRGEHDDRGAPPPGPTRWAEVALPSTPSPSWSIADVRVDRMPTRVPRRRSGLPPTFPPDDAVLADLLAVPPGRALMAYHPRETFDDGEGWDTERLFFLGVDGGWRSLEMPGLGLPDSTHPGADTYGAGALSPDGSTWAAPTRAGIVLVDLATGHSRPVDVPGDHTRYLAWHPAGRRVDVMRLHGASTQRTWSVRPRSLHVIRSPYLLPVDGFADDGSVVTFARHGAQTLWTAHRGRTPVRDILAMPYRHARRGGSVGSEHILFGLNRELLAVDAHSGAPVARLRLSRTEAAGWPRGWWGSDTVWFYEARRGLITWDVTTGRTRILTRVRPAVDDGLYWSASLAIDLMR